MVLVVEGALLFWLLESLSLYVPSRFYLQAFRNKEVHNNIAADLEDCRPSMPACE